VKGGLVARGPLVACKSGLAALVLVFAVAGCKGEPRKEPVVVAAGSGPSTRPAVAAPPDPRLASLPGELWFVEDGPPHTLVRISGGKRLAIEAPLFPSAARLPDGRVVAIRSRGDGSPDSEQLVLVAADGAQTPIGLAAPQVRDPVADRKGGWLVAAIQKEGRSELHRIDVATGAAAQMTDNKEGNFHPVLLPPAAGGPLSIAFVSSRDGDSELYRMPVAGGEATRLTAFHKDDWDPTPSPDGKTIAFASDREGPPRLCLIDPDGTKFRRLTARPSTGAERDLEETQAAWSPDGMWIAYVLRSGGVGQLVVRTIATGAETIVTPADASDAEPAWSPDGAWIAVVRAVGRDSQLIAVPSSGTGRPISITHGSAQLPRWF
jgi:Tol biopolymer transport system component